MGGKLAYQTDILHPSVGSVSVQDGNGSQVGFLWIRSDSGGSGGYSDTYLYKVGAALGESSFLPVAVLQNGSFQAGSADGKVLWTQPDITYRYLWTSGAGSPVPTLEAELTPSGQLAFSDPPPGSGPSPAELSAIKSRVGSLAVDQSAHEQVVAATLGGFFGLVYSGRGTEAWAFFRECYEHGISRVEADPLFQSVRRPRDAWERDILDTMAKSPFWSEVLRINGGSLRPLGSE